MMGIFQNQIPDLDGSKRLHCQFFAVFLDGLAGSAQTAHHDIIDVLEIEHL